MANYKIVDADQLDADMATVANAIRAKGGTSDPLAWPAGYKAAVEAISGDTSMEDGLIKRTLTEYKNDRVSGVGPSAFANFKSLVGVDLPNCKVLDLQAFANCASLVDVNMPLLNFVNAAAFTSCAALKSIGFPLLATIEAEAFYDCQSLAEVDLPAVKSVGYNAFYRCTALTEVKLPKLEEIGGSVFNMCSELTSIDLPCAESIGSSAFAGCYALTKLILRAETMALLNNKNAFTGTPIADGTGYIYVPAALVDTYKADSVWSTYANQFRALEDYTVDGTTTGELDETKI